MNFPAAMHHIVNGVRAQRPAWGDAYAKLSADTLNHRIKYYSNRDNERNHDAGQVDRALNYYPCQSDMLADDWRLVNGRMT